MLTKGQKIYMYLCAIVSMLIAIVTLIPFRTLPFMCTLSNVNDVVSTEMIIKYVVFPVVLVALSIFANVKKYQEIKDGLDRSKIINVMSYFPLISYLVAIIISIIHTLSFSTEPLGFGVWGVVMILLVIYVFLTILTFHFLSNIVIRFDRVGTVIFDAVVGVIIICFILVSWRTNTTYLNFFANEASYVGQGDILLFCIYVLALVAFIVHCYALTKLFKKNNRSIYVNREMFERNYDNIVKREYERAYNDILDDFEEYFANNSEDEELQPDTVEEEEKEDSETLEVEEVESEAAETVEESSKDTVDEAKEEVEEETEAVETVTSEVVEENDENPNEEVKEETSEEAAKEVEAEATEVVKEETNVEKENGEK